MLKRNKFYVYDFDTNLKTALHYASMLNNDEMIKLLMENGADIDARDMSNKISFENFSWQNSFAHGCKI